MRGPAGTNQIILDSSGLHFAQSDEPTFTRSGVDVAWIGERIEILGGVKSGERIAVTDVDKLADGQKVTTK